MKINAEMVALLVICCCLLFATGYCLGHAVGEHAGLSRRDPWAAVTNGE